MRSALFMALVAAPASAMENVEACGARLDAMLATMEARSPLKEELATGLMWMQVEAEEALTSGNAEVCDFSLRRMEALLPESPEVNWSGENRGGKNGVPTSRRGQSAQPPDHNP